MKNYKDAVEYIADNAARSYLSGGTGRFEGIDLVAEIYDIHDAAVFVDVRNAYAVAVDKMRG